MFVFVFLLLQCLVYLVGYFVAWDARWPLSLSMWPWWGRLAFLAMEAWIYRQLWKAIIKHEDPAVSPQAWKSE